MKKVTRADFLNAWNQYLTNFGNHGLPLTMSFRDYLGPSTSNCWHVASNPWEEYLEMDDYAAAKVYILAHAHPSNFYALLTAAKVKYSKKPRKK
jgi:hypothetical protein